MSIEAAKQQSNGFHLAACMSLVLFGPVSGLTQTGLIPIMPKMAEHFAGQPNAEMLVRMLMTGASFAMIFSCIAAGTLASWLGERRLLLWSLAIFAVAGTLGYVVENLWVMLATRLVLGAVTAIGGVMVIYFITSKLPPALGHRWLGFYSLTGSLGTVALIWVIGLVASIDWRLVFLLHLATIPLLLLIMTFVPADARRAERVVAVNQGLRAFPLGLTLLGLAIGMSCLTGGVFVPFHLAGIGAGTPERLAPIFIASSLGSAICAFSYGWVRKYIGVTQIFVIAFFVLGVGLLLIVGTSTYVGAGIGMALQGGATGIMFPNLFAATAAASAPELRARNLGFVRAGFYGGPLLAQLPLEPVSRAYGPSGAIAVIGIFGLALIVATWLGRRSFAPLPQPA